MGIDPEKLLVLFVIALIVLGPERLPKMARSLGRGLAELRKYTSTVQREVDNVLAEPRSMVRSALEEADLAGFAGSLRYIDGLSQRTPGAVPAPGAEPQNGSVNVGPPGGGPAEVAGVDRAAVDDASIDGASVDDGSVDSAAGGVRATSSGPIGGTSGSADAGAASSSRPGPLPDDPSLN